MESDTSRDRKILVTKNGPYVVSGAVPLDIQSILPNSEGGSWTWSQSRSFDAEPVYALCRCGESKTKPYCDGTHETIEFDGTETASREPFEKQANVVPGAALDLHDADILCAVARFCDNAGGIWSLVADSDKPHIAEIVKHEGRECPSGRLVLREKPAGTAVEPELSPSIALVEDPEKDASGPLWVRGGIPVESPDGTRYEVRNRQTLCRCGKSANKPFCDGTHVDVHFKDGL